MKILSHEGLRKFVGVGVMVSALAIGVVAGAAIAGKEYGKHREGGERTEWMANKLSHRLSLSEAQQEKLQTLLQQTQKTRQQLRNNARKQMHAIVTQNTMNRDDALKLLNLRHEARAAMRDDMAKSLADFHAILTPEQRAKMAKIAPRVLRRLHASRGEHGERREHGEREGKGHDRDRGHDEKQEGKGHDRDRGHDKNHDSNESHDDDDDDESHDNDNDDGEDHQYGDSDG